MSAISGLNNVGFKAVCDKIQSKIARGINKMKLIQDVFSNVIFALIVLAIAGCVERIIWISFDSRSYGEITPQFSRDQLAVNIQAVCSLNSLDYIEYKIKNDSTIEIRCSLLPGVSLPFWPFYSSITIKPDYRHIEILNKKSTMKN